jgi:hypothetical protein
MGLGTAPVQDAAPAGLTPGQKYSFRCRVLTKEGSGDWSDVVSHLVR